MIVAFERMLNQDVSELFQSEMNSEHVLLHQKGASKCEYLPSLQNSFRSYFADFTNTKDGLKRDKLISTNKNRDIYTSSYYGKQVVVKDVKNITTNFIAEVAISYIITKLYPYTPNFTSYVGSYFYQKGNQLCFVSSYEGTTTLNSWLMSSNYNLQDFLSYLVQIVFTLDIAQRHYHFCHYDLHTENVFVKDERLEHIYYVDNEYYKIISNKTMKIIDFDQSRLIYKNKLYGFMFLEDKETFTYNPSFDIFKLVHFALQTILEFHPEQYEQAKFLLKLVYNQKKDTYGILSAKTHEDLITAFKRGRKDHFENFNDSIFTLRNFIIAVGHKLGKSFYKSEDGYTSQFLTSLKLGNSCLYKPSTLLSSSYVWRKGMALLKGAKVDDIVSGKKDDEIYYNAVSVPPVNVELNVPVRGMITLYKTKIAKVEEQLTELVSLQAFCLLSQLVSTPYKFKHTNELEQLRSIYLTFQERRLSVIKGLKMKNDVEFFDLLNVIVSTSHQDATKQHKYYPFLDMMLTKLTLGSYAPPVMNIQTKFIRPEVFEWLKKQMSISSNLKNNDYEFYTSLKCEYDVSKIKTFFGGDKIIDISTMSLVDILALFNEKYSKFYYITYTGRDKELMVLRDIVINIVRSLLGIELNYSYTYINRIERLDVLSKTFQQEEIPFIVPFQLFLCQL